MVTFQVQDDVLTLLIHLGYLAYDFDTKEIFIPNYEIREQFISTVRVLGWSDVIKSIQLKQYRFLLAYTRCSCKRNSIHRHYPYTTNIYTSIYRCYQRCCRIE